MSISERESITHGISNDFLNNYLAITSQIHVEGRPDEMKSSPVRRTFCLLVLFDFCLCVLVWIIRTNVHTSFTKEVVNYTFTSSLFDTVVLAAIRFVFLEVMYGGVKSCMPWWIAVSTSVSSAFVIVKMCMTYIKKPEQQLNAMDYITILVTFILCWVETIFLVYVMLPKEKAAKNVLEYNRAISRQYAASTQSLPSDFHEESNKRSPTESIDEFFSPGGTRPSSPTQIRIKEIQSIANDLLKTALEIVRNGKDWKYLSGDAISGYVTYKELDNYKGKIFKVETLLCVSASVLYNDMINNCQNSPSWNPHVRMVKRIETISKNVDILYNISNEALKGYVSPRDFVLLRTWGVFDHCYLISMTSIVHDEFPPQTNIVRGEYGIGVIYLERCVHDVNQSKCIWLMNNDIKGNLFKSFVDRAVPGILLEIIAGLKQHSTQLMTSI